MLNAHTRTAVFILLLMATSMAEAQSGDSSHRLAAFPSTRWSLTPYAGLSAGYGFFNGNGSMLLAVPVGLQLSYKLTSNWYAFTSLSAVPAYSGFSRTSFLSTKTASFLAPGSFSAGQFGGYSAANLGLFYINDARTFSISGSVGVERSRNAFLPYLPANGARTKSATGLNR
jgi:hypothetical protein